MSNILIFNGSIRKNGNTKKMINYLIEGINSSNEIKIVDVSDYKINHCLGCDYCKTSINNDCVQKDDIDKIFKLMEWAETLVFATPLYFYGVSSSLKTIIDRFHTPKKDSFHIKSICLLSQGAASRDGMFNGLLEQYKLCVSYFKLDDKGHVFINKLRTRSIDEAKEEIEQLISLGKTL